MKIYKEQFPFKYFLILSGAVLFVCALTFLPVNNLIFIIDITAHICRYGSLFAIIFTIMNFVEVFKELKEKDIKIKVTTGLFISSLVIYLICFYFNVVGLLI